MPHVMLRVVVFFFTIDIFTLLNVGFQALQQIKFICIIGHFSAYTKAEKVAQLDRIIHICYKIQNFNKCANMSLFLYFDAINLYQDT